MAKRAIVRIGDKTTHGGTVVSGDQTYIVHGKQVARVGDKVACPTCLGVYPIVSGASNVFSRTPIARHDDVTACGAKLIASQYTTTIDDGEQESKALMSTVQQLVTSTNEEEENNSGTNAKSSIKFQAIDPDTGEIIPECPYVLTRINGAQHGGITDKNGFTEEVITTGPEKVAVHFFFKSPLGNHFDKGMVLG